MSTSVSICNVRYRETILKGFLNLGSQFPEDSFFGSYKEQYHELSCSKNKLPLHVLSRQRSQKSFSPVPVGLDVVSRTETGSTWLWQVVSLAGHWTHPPPQGWDVPSTLYIFDWGHFCKLYFTQSFLLILNQDKNCTCMFFYSDISQLNCQKLSAILYF